MKSTANKIDGKLVGIAMTRRNFVEEFRDGIFYYFSLDFLYFILDSSILF